MPILRPSRRDLLKLAGMAPAFALPALPVRAEIGAPAGSNPAHFRFTIGEARLTVVSDGYFTTPISNHGINADPVELRAFLESYFLPTDVNFSHTNHVLIELGDAVVLIDVGSGNRFLETTGQLFGNLEVAGIDPDTITQVVITHAHPDHIWGIRDDFDEAILPGVEYIIAETEHHWWLQDGRVDQVSAEMQQFVVGAVNSLNVDGAEWTLARDGHEVAPGIRLLSTPGHTAGHMSVVVESGGQQLLITGDAMTHAYTNFAQPGWVGSTDQDPEQTVATRLRLLDMAATDRMAVLGYHFPFPGVGHVTRDGDAFRFIPALWRW